MNSNITKILDSIEKDKKMEEIIKMCLDHIPDNSLKFKLYFR